MSVALGPTVEEAVEGPAPSRQRTTRRKGWLLPLWGWLVILWLCAPIIVMIVFGFNDGNGRQVSTSWKGFTFKWYTHLFDVPDLSTAIRNSVTIALLCTLIAVVLGTLMGVAMGKFRYRGSGSVNLLMFANIAAPEVVLGSALLSMFLALNVNRGYLTILIAHVMFSIAYVVVTVRARMSGMDPAIEEAARDLGAGAFTTFFRITLPAIMPGVMSGGLLVFALSIDDYIITSFNAGKTVTFPLWVYGASRTGVPPQVNVMGTLIFLLGVIAALAGAITSRRRRV
jgi:spermidine/putrescine transport system permease protein